MTETCPICRSDKTVRMSVDIGDGNKYDPMKCKRCGYNEAEFIFKKGVRTASRLLIGIAGGTGSGKTKSAMRIATGLSGGKKFAVIDTENDRALDYDKQFDFYHINLTAPFTSQRYMASVMSAERQGYGVVVVDSASHEWSGDGGMTEQMEDYLETRCGDDYRKRDKLQYGAWREPKKQHKRYMTHLIQVKTHVIMCFRAYPKTEMGQGDNGKMEIREKRGLAGYHGWFPECDKDMPFEMSAYMMLLRDEPGIPQPIRIIDPQQYCFKKGKKLDEDTGRALAKWALGSGDQDAAKGSSVAAQTTRADKQDPKPAAAKKPAESAPPASEECVDMMTVINEVKTLEELKSVGKQIKNMSDAAQDVLRPYYTTRLGQLKP